MDINHLFNLAYADDEVGITAGILAGLDPNTVHPYGGHTPLQAASEAGSLNAVMALLDGGAAPNLRFTWESRVDGRRFADRVALMYATTEPVARALVNAGADVNAVDAQGWTPIALALERGDLAVFRFLLSIGAVLHVNVNGRHQTMAELAEDKIAHLRELGGPTPKPKLVQALDDLIAVRQSLLACADVDDHDLLSGQ